MQVDYLQVQRQSVLEPPVQRRSDRYRLPRVDLVERWDAARAGEAAQHEGQTLRPEWRARVHQLEVQMGEIGVAAVADPSQNVAGADAVAPLDPDAAGFEVGVYREPAVPERNDHMVTGCRREGDPRRWLERRLIGRSSLTPTTLPRVADRTGSP